MVYNLEYSVVFVAGLIFVIFAKSLSKIFKLGFWPTRLVKENDKLKLIKAPTLAEEKGERKATKIVRFIGILIMILSFIAFFVA